MAITEDLRKTLTDPTPLYVVAGTVDLTAKKLREVPELIERLRAEGPERIAAAREGTDPKVVQEKVADRAREMQERLQQFVATFDMKQFRDQAQDLALQQVGRAAEAAVWARETYDELAERGRDVVSHLRSEASEQMEDAADALEPRSAKPQTARPTRLKAVQSDAPSTKTRTSRAKASSAKTEPTPRAAAKKTTAKKPGSPKKP